MTTKRKGKRRQSMNERRRRAQGQEREKDEKKGGEGIAENRVEAGKEPAVMVVATSLGNGRWLKNEVIW